MSLPLIRNILAVLTVLLLIAVPIQNDAQTDDLTLWESTLQTALSSRPFAYAFNARLSLAGVRSFGLDFDVHGAGHVDLTGSAPAFSLHLEGELGFGSAYTTAMSHEVLLADQKLYLKNGDADWQVTPLPGSSVLLSGGIFQPQAWPLGLGLLSGDDLESVEALQSLVQGLFSLPLATYFTVERLPDQTDGNLHLRATADLGEVVGSPEFAGLVRGFGQTQGAAMGAYNADVFAARMQAWTTLLQDSQLVIETTLDLSAQQLSGLVIDVNMPVNPDVIGQTDGPFTLTFHMEATLTGLEAAQLMALPDNAAEVPALDIILDPTPPEINAGQPENQVMMIAVLAEGESFSITQPLTAGQTVTITGRGLGWSVDPLVTLLAPDGSFLADSDDHESTDFGLEGLNSQIGGFVAPADGDYTIIVEELNGAASSIAVTIYTSDGA